MAADRIDNGKLEDGRSRPLLDLKPRTTMGRQLITQTFNGATSLANLLPTGTVLAFQLLSHGFTNNGRCDSTSRLMACVLISLCGLSCFFLSFTDSFRDNDGTIRYGIAIFKGLWVIDGGGPLVSASAVTYKIKFIDFVHAFMSLSVFMAIALSDDNIVSCFYPIPSPQTKAILTSLPAGIASICSMLFVAFPTTRHGIGFPIAHT